MQKEIEKYLNYAKGLTYDERVREGRIFVKNFAVNSLMDSATLGEAKQDYTEKIAVLLINMCMYSFGDNVFSAKEIEFMADVIEDPISVVERMAQRVKEHMTVGAAESAEFGKEVGDAIAQHVKTTEDYLAFCKLITLVMIADGDFSYMENFALSILANAYGSLL